jgi:hypothetical protein
MVIGAEKLKGKTAKVKVQTEKGHIQPEHHADALQAAEEVLRVEYRRRPRQLPPSLNE